MVAFRDAAPSDHRVIDQPDLDRGDLQCSPRRGALGRYLMYSGFPLKRLSPGNAGFSLWGKAGGDGAD